MCYSTVDIFWFVLDICVDAYFIKLTYDAINKIYVPNIYNNNVIKLIMI